MDFRDFYNKVKTYALNTETVESFYELDVYMNWNSLHINYASFDCNINYIRRVDNYEVVNCTMYYGQKLQNDSSNLFETQSSGYKAIVNVLNHLKDDYEIDAYEDIQILPFHQKFADILAGCYCDVNIYVPVEDICEDYDKDNQESE